MRVEKVLFAASKRLITIGDDVRLTDAAAKLLRDPDADLVVVCNADKRMVGVISKTDVVRQISRESESPPAASTVMTRTVMSCRPGDLFDDVWAMMKARRLKNVPILDDALGQSACSTRGICLKFFLTRSSTRRVSCETMSLTSVTRDCDGQSRSPTRRRLRRRSQRRWSAKTPESFPRRRRVNRLTEARPASAPPGARTSACDGRTASGAPPTGRAPTSSSSIGRAAGGLPVCGAIATSIGARAG